jgi:hypothetical protein
MPAGCLLLLTARLIFSDVLRKMLYELVSLRGGKPLSLP